MKVTLSVTFDDQRDRDILRRLRSEMNRSAVVRQALRDYYGGPTLDDIYRAITDLGRAGAVVTTNAVAADFGAEPPDVADALDNLGI